MTKNKLLTTGQAAEYVGVSRLTFLKWADGGLVSYFRSPLPNARRRFTIEELERFKKEHTSNS